MPVAAHSSSSCAVLRGRRPPSPPRRRARACAATRTRSTRRTGSRPRRGWVRARRAGYRGPETNFASEMPFATLAQPPELLSPATADPRMEKFIIEGGQPLSGTVVPAGNKNAALPALAATLLTEEEVVLRNVPRIRDVEAMLALLRSVGATTEWRDENVRRRLRRRRPRGRAGHLADRAHPRLVPAGGTAAGPVRLRQHAAARRRRDRPPPAGSAPGRLPRAGRHRRGPQVLRHHRARATACARATSSWTSRR